MFGRRKDNDGTVKSGTDTPAPVTDGAGPRMYRADSAMYARKAARTAAAE